MKRKSSGAALHGGHDRRRFLQTSLLGLTAAWAGSGCADAASAAEKETTMPDILNVLRQAGVAEAAREIGIDFQRTFTPLAAQTAHPYRLYRWSVSHAAAGGPLIQALPPEEEMGWTPWEEWFVSEGKPLRRAMVLYPVRKMTRGVPHWWCLEQSRADLSPRCALPAATLEELFRRHRVFEAAETVGFDAQKVILNPLSPAAREAYLKMRWSIAPHRLAADLPVVQCLPPQDRLDQWPWETWYTDGKSPLIHHVHYAKANERTEPKSWRERDGAPQRPAELFGVEWYWYNDDSLNPALAGM
jgi:hypothetical protein